MEKSSGTIETISIDAKDWQGLLTTAANNGSGAILGVNGKSIYSVDITTGKATLVSTVPATVGGVSVGTTINSVAVDQANGLIYYVDTAASSTNRALFAYDFKTVGITDAARHILIDSDLTNNGVGASIVVGNPGGGGAGSTFGNNSLYLAVLSNTGNDNDDTIYRISFTSGGRTVSTIATLVSPITGTHAWGDLGFDGATNTILDSSNGNVLTRYDAITGAVVGAPVSTVSGTPIQTALGVSGNTYLVGASIQQVNPVTGALIGAAVSITNSAGSALTMLDASTAPLAAGSVGDQIFDDNNINAVFDTGDTGIAGITVQLIDDRNNNGVVDAGERVLATDTTDASGKYLFTGVLTGNYIVRVTDTANVLGTAAYTTAGGAINPNADFVATATNSSISQDLLTIDFGVDNRPPVNVVPAAQTLSEDTSIVISGTSVSDADGNLGTTRLSVTKGNILVSLAGGATISAGANGSGTLTLSGTSVQINNALASITYTPAVNYNGTDVLTVLSTDKAGSIDTDTVNITINSVNDAPGGTDATLTAVEDTARTFTAADFGFTDPFDSPANTLQSVIITTLPALGSIRLNGVGVTAG